MFHKSYFGKSPFTAALWAAGKSLLGMAAFFWVLNVCATTGGLLPSSVQNKTPSCSEQAATVKVTTEREGETTHFYVQNDELCEITMTFEMALVNLKGTSELPFTMTFLPRQKTKAFSLSPIRTGDKWEYSYTNYYKLGSHCAKHDDSYVYHLPYAGGATFKVTQGYNGSFSHKGSNKYAIDWKMPEGTPVLAARDGLVVKVKDDSETGGSSIKFDKFNNYVLIRQDDGTLAHYCHLQKGGCQVQPGQRVHAGDWLARSGNTGFSSGPHLHFCVFKTKDGRDRLSIPVQFRTADQNAITLRTGRNYKATPVETVSAKSSDTAHQGGVFQ
jgi:murein DD-endopeptidase MepM/ murein hydrolase activator NlpD